jgi:uncharacterized CHY-type Zn-finger protein
MKNTLDETIICSLYKEKLLSTIEIGEIYDVSYNTIRRILIKNGVELRKYWASATRICGICKKELPMADFYKRSYWCKECEKENNQKHPRLKSRYKRFGITLEGYAIRLENQRGRCAICGRVSERRLSVDHDHKTGKVRGLLCTRCNTGIGCFCDDQKLLNRAIEYLQDGS